MTNIDDIRGKREFMKALGAALGKCRNASIADVDIKAFEFDGGGSIIEFVVVTFDNGAISVANSSGNSDTANLREVARMSNGGYYDQVEWYLECQKKLKEVKL